MSLIVESDEKTDIRHSETTVSARRTHASTTDSLVNANVMVITTDGMFGASLADITTVRVDYVLRSNPQGYIPKV
jgi:hypothetical protein